MSAIIASLNPTFKISVSKRSRSAFAFVRPVLTIQFELEPSNSKQGPNSFEMNLISPPLGSTLSASNERSFFVTLERSSRLGAWTVRIFRRRSQSRKLYGNGKSLGRDSSSFSLGHGTRERQGLFLLLSDGPAKSRYATAVDFQPAGMASRREMNAIHDAPSGRYNWFKCSLTKLDQRQNC